MGKCFKNVKLWILCVPSTTVGQFLPDTQKRSFCQLRMETSISPFCWARVDVPKWRSGLEDQDFCYRVGLRHGDHPFPGLEKGILLLGGLSEQQRMAKGTGMDVADGGCHPPGQRMGWQDRNSPKDSSERGYPLWLAR